MVDSGLRGISCISVPFTLVLFFMMVRIMGKRIPVKKRTYMLGIVIPGIMLLINAVLMASGVNLLCGTSGIVAFIIGFMLGRRSANKSEMDIQDGAVMVKRSIYPIIFWAVGYLLTQLMATIFPANIVAAGVVVMFFSTGATMGMNFNFLGRHRKLLKQSKIV